MSWGGAVAFAAAFRSVSIDAEICPDGDARTLELGSRHTSGEECLPARTTLGNFLKIVEEPGFVPDRDGLLHADRGRALPLRPVRALLRKVLRDLAPGRGAGVRAQQP